jgi:ubiquinol-cytochrome c reductase cytochrome b subunit
MKDTETRARGVLEFLALDGLLNRLRNVEVPSDALTWSRFCGSLLLVLLLLLFVSGALLAFYYTPAPGMAYDSVDYAQFSVPFGVVVRGVHHYAWNALLAVLGLHLVRAFLVGAYKPPREMLWVSGVVILLVAPLFIITGDLLPWDQKGYWSTQVRNSIMRTVPVVGDFLVSFLQAGPRTGIMALTRFYVLHVLILPAVLLLGVAVHCHFLWARGLAPPLCGDPSQRRRVPLATTLVNRWLSLFILVTLGLGAVSWFWPAALGDPADPTASSYVPKPEWWVLPLNQLVAIFKGPFTAIATAVIPGALLGLLVLLPFVDRSPERRPRHRKMVILAATVIGAILLVLAVMGYIEHYGTPPE